MGGVAVIGSCGLLIVPDGVVVVVVVVVCWPVAVVAVIVVVVVVVVLLLVVVVVVVLSFCCLLLLLLLWVGLGWVIWLLLLCIVADVCVHAYGRAVVHCSLGGCPPTICYSSTMRESLARLRRHRGVQGHSA